MKKIVAIISALAMALSMSVIASAAAPKENGVSVVYNAAKSTNTMAVLEVYAKGYKSNSDEVTGITIKIGASGSYFPTTNLAGFNGAGGSIITGNISGANETINVARNAIIVGFVSASKFTWVEENPIAVINLPITNTLTSKYEFAITDLDMQVNGIDYANIQSQVQTDLALPMTAAVAAGETVSSGEGEAATWFTVTATAADGTPYWYATVDGAAKKAAFTTANISAGTTVTAGLVSTGSVSNAKIVWE